MLFAILVLCSAHFMYAASPAAHQAPLKTIVISRTVTKSYKKDVANDHEKIELLNRDKKKDFFKKFIVLDTRAKLLYLRSLDIEAYQAFLARFCYDEVKWHAFRQSCTDEDRKHLPETLKEQYVLVRDCYYNHGSMGFIQSIRSLVEEQRMEDPLVDIFAWKQIHHKTRGCTNDQELRLDNEFQRRKYEMLRLRV